MPRYNTINIPGGGYESAQQYYGKLKKQFLQQLENSMVLDSNNARLYGVKVKKVGGK